MIVKRICSWCGQPLGEKIIEKESLQKITHGICSSCKEKVLYEIKSRDINMLVSLKKSKNNIGNRHDCFRN